MTLKEIYSSSHSLRDFNKGKNMSIDIEKMESFVSQVKGMKAPRWGSRKMLVTMAAVGALIWFFKGSLATILWQVTALIGLWLLCTTATDIAEKHYQSQVKIKVLENLSKDGLTKEEVEVVEKMT
jgi:hypothetical protein